MNDDLAPIAVFAYRRTAHLRCALDALERCPEFSRSPVFVFSDGPRSTEDARDVAAVRECVGARLRPNMHLVTSHGNQGLSTSIEHAASRLSEDYGKVIVIEDDLVVAPCALTWFNAGLTQYCNAPDVWQVAAHQFNVPSLATRDTGLFLHLTTSWGWATWKRAWDRYDPTAAGWEALREHRELRRRFDVGGYPFSDMLRRQMEGSVDSWAVRWWWTVFRAEGMALFPPRPLVANIGFDKTATHYRFGALRGARPQAAPTEIVCPRLPAAACVLPGDDAIVRHAVDAAQSVGQRVTTRVRAVMSERPFSR